MYIKDFEVASFEKEESPFVLLNREIILKFATKYPFEFCIWAYLQTISVEEFSRDRLIKDFGINKTTYLACMQILDKAGLIEEKEGKIQINTRFK